MTQEETPEERRSALAERIAKLASEREFSLAVAESLTGGMVSSALAAAPGASDWFRGGVVAYSSEVKHQLLDVPPGPVVSEPAASVMARAVRRLLGADAAVAVTGSGGPDSQDGQPPGTVFFAVDDGVRTVVVERHIERDDPAEVCAASATQALRILLDHLAA